MRALLLLTCLLATVAGAQTEPSGSSPDEPAWARPPPSTGPAESAGSRAQRYSRYSAGPAGPTIAVAEVLVGIAGGAILGNSFDAKGRTNNLYTGAMLGGLTLGTGGILYQYFFPVQRRESLLATTASLAGLAGGIAYANNQNLGDRDRALLAILTSQMGMFSSLLLTRGGEDLSGADYGLICLTSAYATAFAGLIEFIHNAETSGGYNFAPMLMAPAIGMALGGLLAIPVELNSLAFAILWPVPLAIGGMAFGLAAPLSGNATTGRVGLIALSGSLVISSMVLALTSSPPEWERTSESTVKVAPVPVVLAAGRGNTGLAAGPGLWIQF
ncbi:hypothetical protein [Hyalangium minutum]|uniref:Uncharacterized protein n=1 Tax=Hyalangium minutum TaxID=394096 RepID=A0A085WKG4_9BACT|nr:hypothetical protein [Hyalangium minutum]KFE68177.1 hypothetical protein DB31_7414 [Hyalangium minutum]